MSGEERGKRVPGHGRVLVLVAAMLALAATSAGAQETAAPPLTIPVTLAPSVTRPQSGRILIFAQEVEPGAKKSDTVDTSPFQPTGTAIAARETWSLAPGQIASVDGETDTFPMAFSKLAPGTYRFQAVLDRNHDYNYGGRGAGDIVSPVIEAKLPGPIPVLPLSEILPETTIDTMLSGMPAERAAQMRANLAKVEPVDLQSASLSAFWGRPIHVQGWVALPPGYKRNGASFPTVYSTGGFGSTLRSAQLSAAAMTERMATGKAPPMIWVYLDESSPTGTHEFADSINNGPWGRALTTEFIPWIETRYAMDAKPSSRFLTGHSSGGWATLWLQVRYPKVFGGSWPTAPDPSDFHDFTNIDIYAPDANAYRDAQGKPLPLVRDHGKLIATLEQFAQMERVLGAYGGQFASFDWVFSPKGPDGRPMPLYDRATGEVDPQVAAYWREHYDIAHIVARDWATLKPDLDGKIHLIVGTADTFYLDGAARRLKAVFDGLGAHQEFTFLPDRTHFDLLAQGDDRQGLMNDIAWAMYAKARPGAKRPAR
ncbi:alpha/beta hydrolase-fold protein [Sphingomonas sp. dw_22]|uniref:alpha/beta hydrolase n=1 Tax=Sphingomonas sp. dw_22 TaxID=2721175 RepID=UPI0021165759|nr:alpha/beta hydrolase-fold protein [Sphingomonas sp. dw_22]